MKQIVIVDGQASYWTEITKAISSIGYHISTFKTWSSAQSTLDNDDLLLVILNTCLPDANGIELAWILRQKSSAPEILIITDSTNVNDAEQAIRSGAWEYLERPGNAKSVLLLIMRIIEYSTNLRKIQIQDELEGTLFEGIAGESPKIKTCLKLASQAAKSNANVLIRGETGTGKELLAWAIHKNSPRANKNFVVVDCAALPETLVESTLMGHERGAFTGADKAQDGLIKQADGGTLFLDEVGELPFSIQKSFLRILEEHRFRRVGGIQEIESDFRLLSAANKNLDLLVQEGKFREDLLFRLRSFMIELPSLRERKEDIKNIIHFHLPRLCNRIGRDIKEISDEYYSALLIYPWPGNVRELVNSLDRSIVAARNESMLFPQHLPTYIRVYLAREKATEQNSNNKNKRSETTGSLPSLQEMRNSVLAQAETEYLRSLMNTIQGDIAEACRLSGLSRSRLYSLLKKYNISSSP
jgi:two-component system, NtrC family, response regulator